MPEGVRCAFANVNGLKGKVDAVAELFNEHCLDLLLLAETHLFVRDRIALPAGLEAVADIRAPDNAPSARGRGVMALARRQGARTTISVVPVVNNFGCWGLLGVEDAHVAFGYFRPDNAEADDHLRGMFEQLREHPEVCWERTVFVGDLNAKTRLLGCAHPNTRGAWFQKDVLEGHCLRVVAPERGRWTTVTSTGKGVTDLVMTSIEAQQDLVSNLTVHESCDLGGSDHRPLTWGMGTARVTPMPTIVRWNVSRLRDASYARLFSDVLHAGFNEALTQTLALAQLSRTLPGDGSARTTAQDYIDDMYAVFRSWLEGACAKSLGRAKYDVVHVRADFVNDTVAAARESLRRACEVTAQTESRDASYPAAYRRYADASVHYKRVCSARRFELFDDFVEHCAKRENTCEFQKRVSAMKKRESRSVCQLDPAEVDGYADHFATTFGGVPTGSDPEAQVKVVPCVNASACSVDFSDESIVKVLKLFERGKAAGPDGIGAELLRHEPELTAQLLSFVFKECFRHAVVPSVWCKANVAPVFKNKGSVGDIRNYRPISLTCTVRRVYERMLLQQYFVSNTERVLANAQGGFRPKRGTLQQIYVLHESMRTNPDAVFVFMDMKAAYDTCNRSLLYRDMIHKYGMAQHMVAVVQSLFDSNVANLVVRGQPSKDIPCLRGLLQGSSLSPILFNLYINALAKRLEAGELPAIRVHGVRINSVFFADDSTLIAPNAHHAQLLLDEATLWADSYGMTYHPQKCEALSKHPMQMQLRVQEGVVSRANETAVCLGAEFRAGKGVVFGAKHSARVQNMTNRAAFLSRLGMNGNGWRYLCSVLVYKSFLRPMIEYGLPLLFRNATALARMEKGQNSALNMVLSCSRTTSRGAKLKLLQVESMDFRQERLQYLFFSSLERARLSGDTFPAAQVWSAIHGSKKKKPAQFHSVLDNPLCNREWEEGKEAAETLALERKYLSMCKHDKVREDGRKDTAASIGATAGRGACSTPALDPAIPKQEQIAVVLWRAGVLTFQQQCANCGACALTRKHALECTGEGERLARAFPMYYAQYTRNPPEAEGILFAEFLANTMDKLYTAVGTRGEGLKIFEELHATAVVIREKASGFIASANGRSFHHPLRHSLASNRLQDGPPKRRRQAPAIPARAPGRPAKRRPPDPGG